MGLLDKLFRIPSRNSFAKQVMEGIRRTEPSLRLTYDDDKFLVTSGPDGCIMSLANIYEEFCVVPRSERKVFIQDVVRSWFSYLKQLPETIEDARFDLMPALRSRAYVDFLRFRHSNGAQHTSDIPHQVIGEHLALTLVYDLPEAMRSIDHEDLDRWGISFYETLETAMHNLGETEIAFGRIGESLYVSMNEDAYNSARMMLTDIIRSLQLKGRPLAMVPNRNCLLITGEEEEEGQRDMLEMAKEARQDPRPITGMTFCLDQDQWMPWLPKKDHPLYRDFQLLHLQSQMEIYDEQQELLNEMIEQKQSNEYAAAYHAVEDEETGALTSYSIWTEGVPTWLPKTDRIALVAADREGTPGEMIGLFDWDYAMQVVGHRVVPMDMYPARYSAEIFPDSSELSQLTGH